MSRTRRTFTEQFKQQAVNLSKELGSGTKAAQELGISESLVRNWTKKSNSEKSLKAVDPTFSVEEFKRLQRENEKQKKVIHILKSAAAFFSQDHLK
jgi:transposase-like protein